MSAQYRPYRDEESVDGLEAAWSDNEPGSIQIYEKTTEELPFNGSSRRTLWYQIAFVATIGLLGFLLGFFSTFHPNVSANQQKIITGPEGCDPVSSVYHDNLIAEDGTIRQKLLNLINGDNIKSFMSDYDNTDRSPGSEHNVRLAKEIEQRFKQYNLDHILVTEESGFKIMKPDNERTKIELLDKNEKVLFSEKFDIHLPLGQAQSKILLTDQIIYVNKGTKEDYKLLDSMKLNETDGKVFVIRQGFYQVYESVIYAQRLGASAILLFPDPDVYGRSSPFPKSFHLPEDGVKSHPTAWNNYGDLIINNSLSSLDFLRPERDKVSVPIIPINMRTAQIILRGLSGPEAPTEWNCFDFTLYLGSGYKDDVTNQDGRSKIRIDYRSIESTVVAPTVTGILNGASEPDRYIIVGSRRDSLSRGTMDSLSGTAVMLEIARAFGILLKEGWRPRRTIIFNSFGAESLNLIGSSYWLERHQKILNLRAVAYINCDLVVIGNQTTSIAASPLLFQPLYNATRQVTNPNDDAKLATVYDAWKNAHSHTRIHESPTPDEEITEKLLNQLDMGESKLPTPISDDYESDSIGSVGSILHQYRKSASTLRRPDIRKLDTYSVYSPFFLGLGIPVVDVRMTFKHQALNHTESHDLLEDTFPLIGTKYDRLRELEMIDPFMKQHKAVGQIIAEMIRDLSDSVFLPFNLFDYAITLKDGYNHFIRKHGASINESFHAELDTLKGMIEEFSRSAAKFHYKQDRVTGRDLTKIRLMNDQLMAVERVFLDPSNVANYDNKHLILPTSRSDVLFPALVEWLAILDVTGFDHEEDSTIYNDILRVHYRAVIYTISNVIQIIDNVETLSNGMSLDAIAKPKGLKQSSSTSSNLTSKAGISKPSNKDKPKENVN